MDSHQSPTNDANVPVSPAVANLLNRACVCTTLTAQDVQSHLAIGQDTHPHLFSNTLTFLSEPTAQTIARAVETIDRICQLDAYRQLAISTAPSIARTGWGPAGVFMGYDFHVGASGPKLIEINTNAGGALLNAAILRAHHACCAAMDPLTDLNAQALPLEAQFVAMFRREWQAQRGDQVLRTVAIVDDAPAMQYLAPEFSMFQTLLGQSGITAIVADAQDLQWRDGALWHPDLSDQAIDLVYNRLTDFYLAEPAHAALNAAYLAGTTVVTPHPQVYATHADKQRLITLSDDGLLASWGVSSADRHLLKQVVPRTVKVLPSDAEAIWTNRRHLFFKPTSGYGSKGTYRGDKITKRVWNEILAGDYVAQELIAPNERLVAVEGENQLLKQDIRAYAYQGQVQLLAARSYAGQTTNFRTPGGGFSPVVLVPEPKTVAPSERATCVAP